MGNSSSKSASSSTNVSPTNIQHDPSAPTRRAPRRRESLQILHGKTSAAPATASFESATGQSTSQTRNSASHSRARSQTSATPGLRKKASSHDNMGGQQSSEKLTGHITPNRSHSPLPPVQDDDTSAPTPQDATINQTTVTQSDATSIPQADPDPDSGMLGTYYASQLARPPRLPLPIEEEILSPGSPIITPADLADQVGSNEEDDSRVARQASMLSSTTVDEDDVGDGLSPRGPEAGPTKHTLLEWKQGGEKVYVTGTFVNWTKKFRLFKNGPGDDPNALSAVIGIPYGTHHLKFLVDGHMICSDHMPTCVDYTNVLVNYIEVGPDDPSASTRHEANREFHQAKDQSADPKRGTAPVHVPPGAHPPQSLPPPTPEIKATAGAKSPSTRPVSQMQTHQKPLPPKEYSIQIPHFLSDLDAPEDSQRFQRASALSMTQPTPPSLPMFLNKSILNQAMPMKDDSSVLTMPNHTVLNHLATSSIKNDVLATSATTRYKRKYVTTIMYTPTKDE